ncbi:hypothetical protein [Pelagibaculum spongiae]|uniref:hypothetical protein n=1 Tax=Pelagibaculum spongiae TaxID=2080658 RepID=UPI0013149668|nr:hypothetical protein [Pelagibaculum spongiae]
MKHNITTATTSANELKKKLEATQVARLEKRFEFKGSPRARQCNFVDAGAGMTVEQCE